MKLRAEQIAAFTDAHTPQFEHAMVAHLRDFTPLHSRTLGDQGVRALIRAGVERASRHGFTLRWTACFYIECMILLGVDFDTDPQYPWAGSILRDRWVPDQTERADLLHSWLVQMLDEAAGPNREFAIAALKRARTIPFEPIPVSAPDFERLILRKMRENHPEKVVYLGERVLRRLIPRAIEEATKYSVATDRGVCLFLGLMFAVGHGVANDPKYPWIAHTLTSPLSRDPERRVERLHTKTMTYLDHALHHFELAL